MEPHLSPYYYHQQQPQQPQSQTPPIIAFHPSVTTSSSQVANGGHGGASADGANATALYPQSVAGKAPSPPLEIVRKKRGRPRKYGTPEAAAAAKRAASASAAASSTSFSPPPSSLSSRKRDQQLIGSPPSSNKKLQSGSQVNNGQCFMPHVISVLPGEDVAQKIRIFVQQSSRELCILSATGSVCNVSLLQPATSGGSVTYDGSFDILSLSGSFVHTDNGERSGGLSACLSASNGHIVGGGLAGPLIALGSVEVIVATFTIGTKKDADAGTKEDNSATTMASPTNVPVSTTGYRPVIEPSVRYSLPGVGVDGHQNMGGFMVQHHMGNSDSDWRTAPDNRTNYDFTGRTGQGTQESPNNGDF